MNHATQPAAASKRVALLTTGTMKDARGREVVFGVQDGSVVVTSNPHSGKIGRVDLETPGQRDEYMRNLLEAFRVADGEPRAMDAAR
jgi:hypothetical protein